MPTRNMVIDTIEADIGEDQGQTGAAGSMAYFPAYSYVVKTGDLVPPWWSRTRDIELQRLLKQNNHLAGIAYAATTKLKNIPVYFIPKDPTISKHVTYAENFSEMVRLASEFGKGLRKAVEKFVYDYCVFDNGGFMEVLGDGPKDGPIIGPAHGVIHRDSLLCTRTGNHEFPVIYEHPKKHKRYKYHFTRIIEMSQQTSGMANMHGVGFSAVSRSFEIGQILSDQLQYKLEKMGSRPASKLIVAKGIESTKVIKSFLMAEELMNNLGLTRYTKTVVIGGPPEIDVSAVDLNNFEPFDEETGTLMAIYALAYTWGLDIRDVWPVQGAKSSDQVANMKARGRLPADFTSDLKDQFDLKLCPPFLETRFDFQDDEEDQLKALNQDIRSRRIVRVADTGSVDAEGQRRMMLEAGDMNREEFVRQQLENGKLEDGTPIAVLFYTEDRVIQPLLRLNGVNNPLHYEDNDKEEVIKQIHVQQAEAYAFIAGSGQEPQIRRARMAIAALNWLEKQYEDIPEEIPIALQGVQGEDEVEENIEVDSEIESPEEETELPEEEDSDEEK